MPYWGDLCKKDGLDRNDTSLLKQEALRLSQKFDDNILVYKESISLI